MKRFATRTTLALTLGMGLTLGLVMLLGDETPSARASLFTLPLLAPQPLATNPVSNALGVPTTADVSIIFSEPISLASASSRTFAVHGSLSPIFTGTYSLSGLSCTVTLDPARSFFPGERIEAVATTGIRDTAGEEAASAVVWHFWTATQGGTGRFDVLSSTVGPAGETRSIALGDLDGDGDLDLAVGSTSQNAVYLNDGYGTFDTTSYNVGLGSDEVTDVAMGDLDGDGDLDLVVGNFSEQNAVYFNDGDGHPFDTISHAFGSGTDWTRCLALGDLDGDGDLDLVVGNEEQRNRIYLNDGDGTFDTISHTVVPIQDYTYGLALGDLDRDGDLDLAVGNMGQSVVYLNDGDGTFDTTSYNVGPGSNEVSDVALGDLDGDGDLDLVTGNDGPNVVYLNDGDGHPFDTITYIIGPASDKTQSIALGDVDGDGDLDLAVGNRVGQNIVYLNREMEVYLPLVLRDD